MTTPRTAATADSRKDSIAELNVHHGRLNLSETWQLIRPYWFSEDRHKAWGLLALVIGLNLFLVYKDGRLVTPELTGTILEGVTRASILQLAKDLGLQPEERRVPIQEWKDGAESGELAEVFACGTAAVVTAVGTLKWDGGEVTVGDPSIGGGIGEVTSSIRRGLLDVQYGRAQDTNGWMTRLA